MKPVLQRKTKNSGIGDSRRACRMAVFAVVSDIVKKK
jgi:hypothetical protein